MLECICLHSYLSLLAVSQLSKETSSTLFIFVLLTQSNT